MWNSRRLPVMACLCALLITSGCSRERQHWKSAEAADTIEAYDAFIQRHPDSDLVTQARARLAQLNEEQDWQRASSTDTAAAYQEFLVTHPEGKWAQEARIRVENFSLGDQPSAAQGSAAVESAPAVATGPVASNTSASGFGVQLGAYTTEASAREEWQKLSGRFSAQLSTLKPRYVAGTGSVGKVYRLQAATQNETQARELCAKLKQKAQPCVVVLP